jgi:hypothetical protein
MESQMKIFKMLLGSLLLFGGAAFAEAKEPLTARGCVTATRTCGWILKMRSGLFYQLQGENLPEAANSGVEVKVIGSPGGKALSTCHSRANAGSFRVAKWHFLRGLCD